MNDALVRVGQILMFSGFLAAVVVQILVFWKIAKDSTLQAMLALLLPGYLLFYASSSQHRLPRLLGIWILGAVLVAVGGVLVAVATAR